MLKRLAASCSFAFAAVLLAPVGAEADTLVWADFSGSDCAGLFSGGAGIENCDVGNDLDTPTGISPFIVKFGFEDENPENIEEVETSDNFPSVTGAEFDLGPGTWSYTPSGDDPGVRFWVAKQGPEFRLHWMVPDSAVGVECPGYNDNYTFDCLNLALIVTSGIWTNPNGGNTVVSHLSFYDTGDPDEELPPIPEPATLLLLGTGLAGVAANARRRSNRRRQGR